MNEIMDVETIYRQGRRRWFSEEVPRKSPQDLIAESDPYWIVLVVSTILDGTDKWK